MERGTGVPKWLGFSWWWLLAFMVLSNLLRPYLPQLTHVVGAFFLLWTLVQPTWLKITYRSSRAVYWYLSGFVLFIALTMLEHFEGVSAVVGDSWIGTVLFLGAGCCYVAGTCYFAGELREFVEQPEDSQLPLNYVWPILFGVYYFQYKLHGLYEAQLSESSRLAGRA